jgi:(R,R)-butanediol dehydrogenase/meso-butanediol dehydrogenase/diacetyl reductase/L-iditol 2-dehydrogenase
MKAAVQKAIELVEVEDVPEPVTRPDQIKVKIAYAGVCGTDIEILEGSFGLVKQPKFPKIEGHEASGTIVEVGSSTKLGYEVGQRVAMCPVAPCGACYFCRNGQEAFCTHGTEYSGAFAEYGVYAEGQVFPIADDVSFEVGTMLEPLSIAMRANELGRVGPGKSVAILGAGPIGMLNLIVATHSGASKVLVSEPVQYKREFAERLGAAVSVDPTQEDLSAIAMEATDGLGFDAVIDCTGKLAGAEQAVKLAGPGGHVVWAAVYPVGATVPVEPWALFEKDLSIHGVFQSPYFLWRADRMLGVLDLKPLISHVYPLEQINQAFADQRHGKVMKALIKP